MRSVVITSDPAEGAYHTIMGKSEGTAEGLSKLILWHWEHCRILMFWQNFSVGSYFKSWYQVACQHQWGKYRHAVWTELSELLSMASNVICDLSFSFSFFSIQFNSSMLYWHDKLLTFVLPKQLLLGCLQICINKKNKKKKNSNNNT